MHAGNMRNAGSGRVQQGSVSRALRQIRQGFGLDSVVFYLIGPKKAPANLLALAEQFTQPCLSNARLLQSTDGNLSIPIVVGYDEEKIKRLGEQTRILFAQKVNAQGFIIVDPFIKLLYLETAVIVIYFIVSRRTVYGRYSDQHYPPGCIVFDPRGLFCRSLVRSPVIVIGFSPDFEGLIVFNGTCTTLGQTSDLNYRTTLNCRHAIRRKVLQSSKCLSESLAFRWSPGADQNTDPIDLLSRTNTGTPGRLL